MGISSFFAHIIGRSANDEGKRRGLGAGLALAGGTLFVTSCGGTVDFSGGTREESPPRDDFEGTVAPDAPVVIDSSGGGATPPANTAPAVIPEAPTTTTTTAPAPSATVDLAGQAINVLIDDALFTTLPLEQQNALALLQHFYSVNDPLTAEARLASLKAVLGAVALPTEGVLNIDAHALATVAQGMADGGLALSHDEVATFGRLRGLDPSSGVAAMADAYVRALQGNEVLYELPPELTPEEQAMLDFYRSLAPDQVKQVLDRIGVSEQDAPLYARGTVVVTIGALRWLDSELARVGFQEVTPQTVMLFLAGQDASVLAPPPANEAPAGTPALGVPDSPPIVMGDLLVQPGFPELLRERTDGNTHVPAGVKPTTTRLAEVLRQLGFGNVIGGIGERSCESGSEHPWGLALDLMNYDKAVGDGLTHFLIENAQVLDIKYVIWDHHIWSRTYDFEPRRLAANKDPHTDHVHVSLRGDHPCSN